MYGDESGDCGALPRSPSRYFVLVGLVVHELRWQTCFDQMVDFRRRMKANFGLKLREELHAAGMIFRPGPLVRMRRNDRLAIIRAFTNELSGMSDFKVIPVVVDKNAKPAGYDVFGAAWKSLLGRFDKVLEGGGLTGPADRDDRGMLLPDHADDAKLTALLRRARRCDPAADQQHGGTGHQNARLVNIIEDPCFRDSRHSFFIQAVDLIAFLLYQQLCPSAYIRRKGAVHYFERLSGIICRGMSVKDSQGIVRP